MNTSLFIWESTIGNISFLILLITTIYYWVSIIFFYPSVDHPLLTNQAPIFINNLKQKNSKNLLQTLIPQHKIKFGIIGMLTSNLLLTSQLIIRWIDSGHFPLSNLYESLLFLSWGLIGIYILIEIIIKNEVLGFLISPVILCINTFSGFSLPLELQQSKPLVPALQSNWLFMHVSVMICSYAALIFGCLLAIIFLVLDYFYSSPILFENKETFEKIGNLIEVQNTFGVKKLDSNKKEKNLTIVSTQNEILRPQIETLRAQSNLETSSMSVNDEKLFLFTAKSNQNNIYVLLDNLSYRIIGIGFCFLTLGILSGAVWANETWGNYWSWDPKETWALITWLTFSIYLHTRIVKGLSGSKPAWIAAIGFVIIWICYLGVNLLGKGLHSYGFFNG